MRKSAYMKALDQAMTLPTSLPEMKGYFSDDYNPRDEAIFHIIKKARLFHGEFCDLYMKSLRLKGIIE